MTNICLYYVFFFWAEAIATTCFTQSRSLVIPRHEKTTYHIINGRKPSVKFFHIFGSLFYIVKDGENLDKMIEKGDACIFVGFSTQSRAYRIYNKRTRVIVETIHVNFDELPQMAPDHFSSDPVLQYLTTALKHDSLSPGPQSQETVPHTTETVTTSNELDLLFSLMFDELLNGSIPVVSKSSVVTTVDAPNQRQQQHTTPSTSTTIAADTPTLNIQTTTETTSQAPTVTANENIIQAESNKEDAQVDEDEFINIFSTPIQERGETSSRYIHPSNMHTFYQRHLSKHRWTKDHPLEQVIGNPSQSIRTRRQLETDGEMCMSALYEELCQFDRLDVWKLVDNPLCKNVINMKWLWKNKRDEENTVIRNKARLVAKGYSHVGTPMATKHLDADLSGTPVDQMNYRSMVRALIDEWQSFQSQPQTALRSYTLSWKPCQGDSLNLPDHRKKLMHTLEDFTLDQIQKHLRIEEETRIREKNLNGASTSKVNYVDSGKNKKGNDKNRKGTWNSSKDNKKDKSHYLRLYAIMEQVDTTEITTMVFEINIDLDSNIIVESRDVYFFKNKFPHDSTSTNEIVTQIPQDISSPDLSFNNKRNMAESSSAPRRSERARKERNLDPNFIDS
ncbi:putative ribonuclease H-like domain-containing protein [Tanacetum coccineum]